MILTRRNFFIAALAVPAAATLAPRAMAASPEVNNEEVEHELVPNGLRGLVEDEGVDEDPQRVEDKE